MITVTRQDRGCQNVLILGSSAARTLSKGGRGRVVAVFNRSIYCLIKGDYFCVGVRSLGMCPLNVVTCIQEGNAWANYDFQEGMPVQADHGQLRIGTELDLDLSGATVWHPPHLSTPDTVRAHAGINAFDSVVGGLFPDDGLGRLAAHIKSEEAGYSHLLNFTKEPVYRLSKWLVEALRHPEKTLDPGIEHWKRLIGLGPGLTPSGDDLIGGVMLALHRLGFNSVLAVLSEAVHSVLDEMTTPLSAAHLRAAMNGGGNESVHTAMETILTGDSYGLQESLKKVGKVGHTSGWDAMGGVIIVLRLWLEANIQEAPQWKHCNGEG